jgi:hypothetical protein
MASEAEGVGDYLLNQATRHAAAIGRRFGDGAYPVLIEMTAHAGATLEAAGASPKEIASARDALIELLDRAVEIAQGEPDYPDDLLGERSFFPALSWFCPRHPFC